MRFMAGASRVDLGPHLRQLPKPVTSDAQAAPPRLGRMKTDPPRQICLPGQTHVAEGPHDQTGMYVMHHAFRRDLDRFHKAVRATPVDERDTWRALAARWERFAEVLHHHHTVEDEHIWPVMERRLEERGELAEPGDLEALHAMTAEHDLVDPALEACGRGFAAMAERPSDDQRNA